MHSDTLLALLPTHNDTIIFKDYRHQPMINPLYPSCSNTSHRTIKLAISSSLAARLA